MACVDRMVLQQLADDIGHEMLPVVIAVFIEEVGGQLSQLRPLYEQGEWEALARVAHSMKSSCGSYGALSSYHQVMALEMASKQADVVEAERQLKQLEASLPQVFAFLADYQ
ncbi:MAG: Hpt domain-containing protein [Aeromonas sp.]